MDDDGLVTTTANAATLWICQNDSSMAILLCHVVEGYVGFSERAVCRPPAACPLLPALVYWTARCISLPTIY